jgi:hypothetical protein
VLPLIGELGLLGFALGFFTVLIRYLEHRHNKKNHSMAWEASKDYFHDTVLTPLLSVLGLLIVLGFLLGPYEMYQRAQQTIGADEEQLKQIPILKAQLQSSKEQLQNKRHNIDTSDPVFLNLVYMLQAFRTYRAAMGGFNKVSCGIRFTSPSDSGPLASTIAQTSIQITNCSTFGPMDARDNPDEERDTTAGMIPETVIFHARRDDKAAVLLYDNLASLLQLKRSYVVPAGSPDNFIWLQFGSGVKWNSERIRPHFPLK